LDGKSSTTSYDDDDVEDEEIAPPTNATTVTLNPLEAGVPVPAFSSPSSHFRRMYITSDYGATRKNSPALSTSPSSKPNRCAHGLPFGICTENACCTITSAVITRTDQRQRGNLSGRKLVEYHIAVEFKYCNASIWHRYSGFRSFFELFVQKYGADKFGMFPRKHINKWSSTVTTERVVALNQFLSVIIQDDVYREDDLFKSFLSVDENARRQFYEADSTSSFKVERAKIKEAVNKRLDQLSKDMNSESTLSVEDLGEKNESSAAREAE
jgi:hypothetical protein